MSGVLGTPFWGNARPEPQLSQSIDGLQALDSHLGTQPTLHAVKAALEDCLQQLLLKDLPLRTLLQITAMHAAAAGSAPDQQSARARVGRVVLAAVQAGLQQLRAESGLPLSRCYSMRNPLGLHPDAICVLLHRLDTGC